MSEILVRYAHFIGIIVLASMLVVEHMLVKNRISVKEVKRIAVIDAVYGGSAVVVFFAGLSLWLWVGKPSAFYTGNPIFHAKLVAFVLLVLLSIYPTVFYLKHRKSTASVVDVPNKLVNIIRAELFLLLLIPLFAVFMARGYSFF